MPLQGVCGIEGALDITCHGFYTCRKCACTLYMNTVKKGTISLPESRSEKPPRAAISDGSGA